MPDFRSMIEGAGLLPRDLVPDGRIRRCATQDKPRKRNGWYVLHPDGHGAWGDWGSGSGAPLGTWRDEAARVDPADSRLAQRRQADRAAERAARIRAMRSARSFWSTSRRCRSVHPYLAWKGLSALGTQGLREHGGLLVVPVWHGDWVISVQTIAADGQKRFWTGAPVKGGACVIERERAAVTVVCEGLATGLAVYQASRQVRVIVAFDCGNIAPVIQRIKPAGSVVIAADNDLATQVKRGFNPGLEKARAAAELIGCGVAYPEGIEGSDFADMLKELGPAAPKRIERTVLGAIRYVPREAPM